MGNYNYIVSQVNSNAVGTVSPAFTGSVGISGTLAVSSNTTVGGTFGVTGATTLGALLTITAGGLAVTGGTTTDTLAVTGNATVGGTLGVTGNAIFSGALGTTGAATIGGNLTVSGGTVTATTFTGNAATATSVSTVPGLKSQIFSSSSSWTAPSGVSNVKVTAIGGGGGGVWCTNAAQPTIGGFGGVAVGTYSVTPLTLYTVTVGAGGAGSQGGTVTAGSGASSSFGSLCVAPGGTGAACANITYNNGVNGSPTTGNIRNSNAGTFEPLGGLFTIAAALSQIATYKGGATASGAVTWLVGSSWAPGAAGITDGSTNGWGGSSGCVLVEWVA
jgi:hypothetical protein